MGGATAAYDAQVTQAYTRLQRALRTRTQPDITAAINELDRLIIRPVVRRLIARWTPIPLDDALQVARIAVVEAAPRYDPARKAGPFLHRVVQFNVINHARAEAKR